MLQSVSNRNRLCLEFEREGGVVSLVSLKEEQTVWHMGEVSQGVQSMEMMSYFSYF